MSLKTFNIPPVDNSIESELQEKIDGKTKPVGALGQLERIALKLGLIQQSLEPELVQPIIAVFAGDHGIAGSEKVSAYPQKVTWQMVQNFLNGGAAINVFCRAHGITSKIIDAGVAFDFPDHEKLIKLKVAKGTRNYALEPAMNGTECLRAIHDGAELVDRWHQKGCNIIGLGEMGIGNTSSASIITSMITGKTIEECTGKGTGLDNKGVEHKVEVLNQAIDKHKTSNDPLDILATFGGFEIAMITGAILQAAEHHMCIIADGFIVTAAVLIARELYPNITEYVLYAHKSDERGHQIQLEYLQAEPILRLGMRLGEGTAAAVAYPIIKSAAVFLNTMASFDDAGVSKKATE